MTPREFPAPNELFKAWQGITDRVQILALTQPIALALIIREIHILLDRAINSASDDQVQYEYRWPNTGE
jgi:hypothetical protein